MRPKSPLLALLRFSTVLFLGLHKVKCLGLGWTPGQEVVGHCWPPRSGSTRSQRPPSARRTISGFLRGSSSSGRTRKRSSVSARTTFISVMANVCPMQFLGPAEKGIKARGDLFWGLSGSKRKGLYTSGSGQTDGL